MLTNIIHNSMDTSNPSKGSITTTKLFGSILRTHAPNSVLGVAKLVCQTLLFYVITLAMPDFQPVTIFQMVATLCDGMDTPRMVVTLVKDS
jgi:hypothetical protein